MKTSKGFAQIAYIVIIAALVAAVGYLALKPKSNTNEFQADSNNNQQEEQQTNNDSDDNNDDEQPQEQNFILKTYQNSNPKYSIQYPNDWYNGSFTNTSVAFGPDKSTGQITHDVVGEVFVSYADISDYPWGLKEYDKNLSPLDLKVSLVGSQFEDRQENKVPVNINGNAGVLVTVTSPSTPEWISKTVFVEKDSRIYEVNYTSLHTRPYEKEFEAMWKSLKFN